MKMLQFDAGHLDGKSFEKSCEKSTASGLKGPVKLPANMDWLLQ